MNAQFYRDLRKILLDTREKWQGRYIVTCGEEDPRMTCMPSLECPRVPQPNSDNEISGPTC